MKAEDVMCKNILYANAGDSIEKCASILKENNIGFLPIEKNGKVLGVVTDRDLCILGITKKNEYCNSVETIMTKNIIVVNYKDPLSKIYETMEKYRIKRVLVHKKNKIVGIISLSDLLTIEENTVKLIQTIKKIYELDQTKVIEEPKVNEFYL